MSTIAPLSVLIGLECIASMPGTLSTSPSNYFDEAPLDLQRLAFKFSFSLRIRYDLCFQCKKYSFRFRVPRERCARANIRLFWRRRCISPCPARGGRIIFGARSFWKHACHSNSSLIHDSDGLVFHKHFLRSWHASSLRCIDLQALSRVPLPTLSCYCKLAGCKVFDIARVTYRCAGIFRFWQLFCAKCSAHLSFLRRECKVCLDCRLWEFLGSTPSACSLLKDRLYNL